MKNNRDELIFTYWDGQKERKADAFRLNYKFETELDDMFADAYDRASDGDPSGVIRMADTLRKIFDLSDFNEGEGLTDTEVLEVWGNFMDYNEKKKKKARSKQNLRRPMTVAS